MQTLSRQSREHADIRALYHDLQHAPQQHLAEARQLLRNHLQQTAAHLAELPNNPAHLEAHILRNNARTASAYRDYLLSRKQGQPRRYFSNRAHALYFLRNVAATKLVDGAWLYGVLGDWHDPRRHDLVRTYLEELGDGEPDQNHVLMYKQLLANQDIQHLESLPTDRFIQGTLQLALGHLASEFLPEVIGYNLGYEQLPLHLMITTYELAELGIDPHYFRLHITIDNASSGHAHRAARAVLDNLPGNEQQTFYHRVRQGFQLNALGSSSTDVINAFNLDKELYRVLEDKARAARHMHSDFCRIDGRTINEWLDTNGRIPALLDALQRHGWVHRHQDPSGSRFWRLIQGNRAPMFGVFSAYELQLLHDWIAGEWQCKQTSRLAGRRSPSGNGLDPLVAASHKEQEVKLQKKLHAMPEQQRTQHLIELMAPARHFTPEGLAATRLFSRQIRQPPDSAQFSVSRINTR
ncbi:MAG: iron-containing redox enzyme family protein [Pseudomonas sp.]